MTSPAVREFEIEERGKIRDLILDYFRYGLRGRTNPETGALFTEDDIARSTAPGTRWYREAQAIDDYGQGEQRKALFINDQLRINRASTQWLEEYHGPQWDPGGRLPASSGSGSVTITGTVGTIVVASTTVPDETAYWGRTASGVRVQVFDSGPIGAGGVVATMIAMDPGGNTNLSIGDVITWASRDPGMAPTATVSGADWTGGFDVETDAEWASRMEANQKHKPGAGNDAQQRAWARAASNAIEDAFIYPCAFGNGSVLICILQKRAVGDTTPQARVPNYATHQAAIKYLTPPGSPVEPTPPAIIVAKPWPATASFGIKLSLLAGSDSGWTDARPFPSLTAVSPTNVPHVYSATGTTFVVYAPDDDLLPGDATLLVGSAVPHVMGWNAATSTWTALLATQAERTGVNYFTFTMSSVPSWVTYGVVISPDTSLAPSIAQAIRDYMDERGPFEMFSDTDYRYARCSRFPDPREENPSSVGAEIVTRVLDAIVGAAADGSLPYFADAFSLPPTPAPQMYFLGRVGIYP